MSYFAITTPEDFTQDGIYKPFRRGPSSQANEEDNIETSETSEKTDEMIAQLKHFQQSREFTRTYADITKLAKSHSFGAALRIMSVRSSITRQIKQSLEAKMQRIKQRQFEQ